MKKVFTGKSVGGLSGMAILLYPVIFGSVQGQLELRAGIRHYSRREVAVCSQQEDF